MANPRRRRGEAGAGGDVNHNHNNNSNANSSSGSSNNPPPSSSNRRPGGSRHRDYKSHHRSSSWRNGRCWLFTILLSLISFLIISIYLYNPNPAEEEDIPDASSSSKIVIISPDDMTEEELSSFVALDSRPASAILRTILNTSQDLLMFEHQLATFLAGERLATLLKEELQPVQDRVTSLTTQTSGYEKMDHISGGPAHFIATSIQELDALEENQLAKLDDKVTSIIAEETTMAIGMGDSIIKLFDAASFIIEEVPLTTALLEEGIDLSPGDELEPDQARVEALMKQYPISAVLPVLADLADKLALKEAAIEGVQQVRNQLGLAPYDFRKLSGEAVSPEEEEMMNESGELSRAVDLLEWRTAEVDEVLEEEENELKLQLVIPLHTQILKRVQTLQDDLLNYATQKRRGYLNLRQTLMDDLRKLRTRIHSLRYKYIKLGTS